MAAIALVDGGVGKRCDASFRQPSDTYIASRVVTSLYQCVAHVADSDLGNTSHNFTIIFHRVFSLDL